MKKRAGTIDLFRIIFMIGVVCYHYFTANLASSEVKFFKYGFLGVEFFFIVSGLLLAMKADREKERDIGLATGRMMRGRFLSMMPYTIPAFIIYYVSRILFSKWSLYTLAHSVTTGYVEMLGLEQAGWSGNKPTQVYWYVSVLYIVSFLFYPLLLKYKDTFRRWIAPVVAVMGYGFMFHMDNALNQSEIWYTIIFKGLLRGLAGMALGAAFYELKLWLDREETPKKNGIAFAEIFGYVAALYLAFFYNGDNTQLQFIFPVVIAPSIAISFSQQSFLGKLFKGKAFTIMGELSLCLYLNHNYLTVWLGDKFPQLEKGELWAALFGFAALFALVSLVVGRLLKKILTNGRSVFAVVYSIFFIGSLLFFANGAKNEVSLQSFEGSGTKTHPYEISDRADLERLRDLVADGKDFAQTYFLQTDDIDLGEKEWTPIGVYQSGFYFTGVYDGGNHKIYNLNMHAPKNKTSYLGLFGTLQGVVCNLGIESGDISGSFVGSFASFGRTGFARRSTFASSADATRYSTPSFGRSASPR